MMSRRRPRCKTCHALMQGHKRVNGALVCPVELSPTPSETVQRSNERSIPIGRIMPCSLDPDVWMGLYYVDIDSDGDDEVEFPRSLSPSEGSVASGSTNLVVEDFVNPLDNWPLASTYCVPSSQASEVIRHARDLGLCTRVVPRTTLVRSGMKSTEVDAKPGKMWKLVLGTNEEAVEQLFALNMRELEFNKPPKAQHRRSCVPGGGILKLFISGMLGGWIAWSLLL